MARLTAETAPFLLLYLLAASPSYAAALTDTDMVFQPPNGLALLPSNHVDRPYGATGAYANWNVAQWGIPEDLPPFDATGNTQNDVAGVSFSPDAVTLRENTARRPCERFYVTGRRQVDEFDLFVQPSKGSTRGLASAARNASRKLMDLMQVIHSITVEPRKLELSDTECRVSQVGLLTSVVITNKAAHQTFFYQIRLAMFRSNGVYLVESLPPSSWFFTGNNLQNGHRGEYGFGDDITSYDNQPAELGATSTYRLDLLPRLRELIALGVQYGMDQDLRHWILSGTYHGTSAFGHVRAVTRWSGFSLTAR